MNGDLATAAAGVVANQMVSIEVVNNKIPELNAISRSNSSNLCDDRVIGLNRRMRNPDIYMRMNCFSMSTYFGVKILIPNKANMVTA